MESPFDPPFFGRRVAVSAGVRSRLLQSIGVLLFVTLPIGAQEFGGLKPSGGRRGPGAPAAGRSTAAELKLVIAATTDVHGNLRGWDYYANRAVATRGLARVSTILDSVRAANPERVVLVDAGDLLQGNPLTYVAAKIAPQRVHPVIASMNLLKYDAAVVGNHEFNYGVPFLDAAVRQARFPFLAANVRNANGTQHFPSTATIVRSGVRVAVIGATTTGSMIWDGENLRAARVTVTDVVPAVRIAVTKARAQGADVVVVLLHSGLDNASAGSASDAASENVAQRVPAEIDGIDLVVFGHTHSELIDSTINGAMLMQPRNWATTVGIATLTLVQEQGKWRVTSRRGTSVPAAGHSESKAVLAAVDGAHKAAMRWANAPIGHTAAVWRGDSARVQDSPIVDLVAEVMRREAKSDLATTTSFSLDARLDSGPITVAQLSQMYPYDNTLRAVRIDGKQLRAFLEHSALHFRSLSSSGAAPSAGIVDPKVPGFNYEMVTGVEYAIDLRNVPGQRITALSFRGKLVTDSDTFTLALSNYRQGGGGGYTMLAKLPVTYAKDTEIRQLLIDEVKQVGTLQPSSYFKQNWRLEPVSAVAIAYAEQNSARVAEASGRGGVGTAAPASDASATSSTQPSGRTLRVLTVSDFHAALEGRKDEQGRTRGGVVALQAAIAKARAECTDRCTSITIDGGDMFSGSPASDWAAGKPTVAALNRLGISAGALGNHEFDFGQDTLRQRLTELKHRVLGANVAGTDGKMPAWLRADTIVERDGLRIGIVGAAAQHTPNTTKRRNVAGLQFLAPAPIVSARIKALRAQNVDAVIVTIHDGVRCTNIGLNHGCEGSGINFVRALTDKPDAVVLAHAHTNVSININGIPAVQVLSSARGLGVIDIPLNGRGAATSSVRDVMGDSLTVVDPVLDTIVRNSVNRVRARLEQPVATIKDAMLRRGEQYGLGNLLADAMRVIGNADFGAWNNGGIRADLRAGPLNYGAVHEVAPFGNVIVKLSVRGKDVRTMLETFVSGRNPNSHVSGLQIVFDGSKPAGQRIVSLTTPNGRELEANRVYVLAVNDFMTDDTNFNRADLIVSTQFLPTEAASAIAEYLRRLPQPVVAPSEIRIRSNGESR